MHDWMDPTTLAKLKAAFGQFLLYGGLAFAGGFTKVILGIQKGETVLNAVVKYMIVSIPIGVFCGWAIEELTSFEFAPFAIAFLAGHISYNIITSVEQHTSKWFVELITRGKFK